MDRTTASLNRKNVKQNSNSKNGMKCDEFLGDEQSETGMRDSSPNFEPSYLYINLDDAQ